MLTHNTIKSFQFFNYRVVDGWVHEHHCCILADGNDPARTERAFPKLDKR